MRKFLAILFIMFALPATASEWQYENLGTPIAYFDNGAAQLQFACRGGDLTLGYWVRSPSRQVASASSLHLAMTPDPKSSDPKSLTGASFAQDMPLIHLDGASMIIRGPVARNWAHLAQKAKTTLRVAYVRKAGAMEVFDSNDFGANGSNAAIRRVLERCG